MSDIEALRAIRDIADRALRGSERPPICGARHPTEKGVFCTNPKGHVGDHHCDEMAFYQ